MQTISFTFYKKIFVSIVSWKKFFYKKNLYNIYIYTYVYIYIYTICYPQPLSDHAYALTTELSDGTIRHASF